MTRLVTVPDAQRELHPKLLNEFAASGLSVGAANTVLNPIEVIKTRMQLAGAAGAPPGERAATQPHGPSAGAAARAATRTAGAAPGPGQSAATAQRPGGPRFVASSAVVGTAPAGVLPGPLPSAVAAHRQAGAPRQHAALAPPRPGFAATARVIMQQEGAAGFTRGIQASAARAVFNGGIRLGLYDPIKTLMSRDGTGRDLNVGQKLAAGSISGGIGAVSTTPIELVKTRLQAPGADTRSALGVVRGVVAAQGVLGLWRGATPSVLRLILLNSSMVATYDEVKGRINALTGWGGGLKLTLASSMVAGVVTTTVINPADVCRAYMQTGRGGRGVLEVARTIYRADGAAGFMRGWTAAYARTGPQTLIIFSVSEVLRPLFGLKAIGSSG
ncbi:MAG: mitochondrial carrier domain-containing protein [Monoraphidium minutum]|nr:MAG: mitochondrial carrier domain-containing protein [Monoraphidium minutum]